MLPEDDKPPIRMPTLPQGAAVLAIIMGLYTITDNFTTGVAMMHENRRRIEILESQAKIDEVAIVSDHDKIIKIEEGLQYLVDQAKRREIRETRPNA